MYVLWMFLKYRIKKKVYVYVLGVSKSSMHISYYAATLFLMLTLCFIDNASSNGKITFITFIYIIILYYM